jgi:hypothetical protein
MSGTATQDQADRIEAAVLGLVRSGVLTAAQAVAVTTAVRPALGEPPAPRRSRWPEILGYVGGAVTVVAVLLLVSMSWADLGRGGRVAVLAGTAVALFTAGTVIGGGTPGGLRLLRDAEPERRRLVSTLWSAGVVAAGGAAAVAVSDENGTLAAGGVALVLGAAGYALVPSLLGQLVLLGAALLTTTGALVTAGVDSSVAYGVVTAAAGAVWILLAWLGAFTERVSGVALGLAVVFTGAQVVTWTDGAQVWGYAMTTVTAFAAVAVYIRSRRWIFLALGLVALMTVVLQVVLDVFGQSLTALWLVLAVGLVLLAVSGVVLRTRQDAS